MNTAPREGGPIGCRYTGPLPTIEVITLLVLGFAAGILGGLLGIGGSILMIPVLTLVFRHDQHLSQAAAMIVNVFVTSPALLRHQGADAVEWKAVRRMLPAGLVCIVVGVEVSNELDGEVLMKLFAVFLLYVVFVNVHRLIGRKGRDDARSPGTGWVRCSIVGCITGFAAGLLGIGGGILTVPLLQRVCHLPLRRAIASSAAIMVLTAIVGAIRKNWVLDRLVDASGQPLDPYESLLIAAFLAPTAIVGGHIGAGLTHSLPLAWVRIALTVVLALASAKLFGLF